jgi:hypothetical protein
VRGDRIIAGLLLAGLCLSLPAWSASQRSLRLEEMVDLSTEVVVGRVVSNETRWEGRLIVTVSTVEVGESIKGSAPARIEITQLGGTAVHPETGLAVTMSASSQVGLGVGEEVLLFVHRTDRGLRQLVGAQQGKYVVREDPSGEARLPVAPKRLLVVREPDGTSVRAEPMTLDAMRERIRARVERTSGRTGGR